MKRMLSILLILLLFLPLASSSDNYFPAYSQWQFGYEATNATFETAIPSATLYVENGVARISAYTLGNLTKGYKATLNLSLDLSPETVMAGFRVLFNGEVIFHKTFEKSGNYSVEFFITNDYPAGSNFTMAFYDIGGKLKAKIEPLRIQVPSEGLSEGLLLTGVGITVVFSVLSVLAVIMYLLKPDLFKKKKGKKEVAETRKEMPLEIKPTAEGKKVDEEIVAVITGALSLYLGGEKFRIISVKPSPWKYYGRLKQMRRWK